MFASAAPPAPTRHAAAAVAGCVNAASGCVSLLAIGDNGRLFGPLLGLQRLLLSARGVTLAAVYVCVLVSVRFFSLC